MVFIRMVHRESQCPAAIRSICPDAVLSLMPCSPLQSGVFGLGSRAGDRKQAQPLDLWEHGSLGDRAQRGGFIGHDRAGEQ